MPATSWNAFSLARAGANCSSALSKALRSDRNKARNGVGPGYAATASPTSREYGRRKVAKCSFTITPTKRSTSARHLRLARKRFRDSSRRPRQPRRRFTASGRRYTRGDCLWTRSAAATRVGCQDSPHRRLPRSGRWRRRSDASRQGSLVTLRRGLPAVHTGDMGSGDEREGDRVKRIFPVGEEPEETVEIEGTEEWLTTEVVGPDQLSPEGA